MLADEQRDLVAELVSHYESYQRLMEEMQAQKQQNPANQIELKKLELKSLRLRDKILRLEHDLIPDLNA